MKANGSNLYEIYNQRRDDLLKLAYKQAKIVAKLKMDQIQTKGTKQGEIVKGLIARLKTDKLRVLIVGRFSAGKSTFVNALLGEKLLPSTPNPTTGVLCEINYAQEQDKKATLYPKQDTDINGNGDQPFDVAVNKIEEYIKIQHFNDSKAASPYERMELLYPLELCKNGVELIDSVGLDDPDARDDITLNYAQSVDAVLYLIKSQDAPTKTDLDIINLLRSQGYKSLFFIITYYDHIKESARDGELSEEKFQKFVFAKLSPLTELGDRGIKFVDSRSALRGKTERDKPKLVESRIEEVEKALESFLVEQKGRAKLLTSIHQLGELNRAARKVIPSRMNMLQTPVKELEKRYDSAKGPLDRLEKQRRYIVKQVDYAIANIVEEAYHMANSYFQELVDNIPAWADEYEIEAGIGFPPRKSTLEPVVKEVLNHLKQKIESHVSEWTLQKLSPVIERGVQQMQDDIEGEAQDFLKSADKIRLSISIGDQISDEEIAQQKGPSVWGRLVAGGYTLLTGDFITGGMGMVMGMEAMLKTILIQVVAAIILAIFGLLMNPVAIVVAAIGSILAGGWLNFLSLKDGIKKNVSKKLCEELANRTNDLAMKVKINIQEKLMKLRNALDAGLAGEISSVRDEVEKILNEGKQAKLDAQTEIHKLRQLEEENVKVDEKLDSLMLEAGLIKS